MWIKTDHLVFDSGIFDAFQVVHSSQGFLLRGLREEWVTVARFDDETAAKEALGYLGEELVRLVEQVR